MSCTKYEELLLFFLTSHEFSYSIYYVCMYKVVFILDMYIYVSYNHIYD